MDPRTLTAELKSAATRLGFQLSGACPAATPSGIANFREWLERGYAGEMTYLPKRSAAYEHPRHVLQGVRSILMLGMNYRTAAHAAVGPGQGRVSRYAWGPADYHDVVHDRLRQLILRLLQIAPDATARGVVDTAPLLEREFARLAGLGWIGKNTLLLNRQAGSWFFLAALLCDCEFEYDAPSEVDHCGTCRACLDACPTAAFPEPYVLDATRCISYLTIEKRGPITSALREGLGEWLFGCDVCQDVCPWNRRAPRSREPSFQPGSNHNPLELGPLFTLSDADFRQRFRGTPLWRPKRRGLLRNAAIVLGNQQDQQAVSPLSQGLHDVEPLVRGACAWALGQLGCPEARRLLAEALEQETDDEVRAEIRASLPENV